MDKQAKHSPITVVDSLMGSGKSRWAIQQMRSRGNENFLYITPFLDEVKRFIKELAKPSEPGCGFGDTPRAFMQPEHKGKGKLESLNALLENEEDICSTHMLFRHFNDETKEILAERRYTLIIDEALSVVEPYDFKAGDFKILLKAGCVTVDENNFVTWHDDAEIPGDISFSELRNLARNRTLLYINKSFLVWEYPPEIFRLFDKIIILTYMFEASLMNYYFELHDFAFQRKSVQMDKESGRYFLCEYTEPDKGELAKLINIYEGNMNHNFPNTEAKQKDSWLSASWFRRLEENKKAIAQLKRNTRNYLRNILKASSDTILWTTFKKSKEKLKGDGYTSRFEEWNCRATNKHAETYNIAYILNIYPHVAVTHYFHGAGIKVDDEAYALIEMLQFVWRSRIRSGEGINIYIPSNRMRHLLQNWLKK